MNGLIASRTIRTESWIRKVSEAAPVEPALECGSGAAGHSGTLFEQRLHLTQIPLDCHAGNRAVSGVCRVSKGKALESGSGKIGALIPLFHYLESCVLEVTTVSANP